MLIRLDEWGGGMGPGLFFFWLFCYVSFFLRGGGVVFCLR